MQFKLEVSPVPVINALHQLGKDAGYSIARGLNQLANKAQAEQRDHMRKAFKLRREQFNLRAIYISKADRANRDTWRVVIQVRMPDDRHYLQEHEGGQVRVPHGGKFLWQPNPAVFKSQVITRANPLHPKNLQLRRTKGGVLAGKARTFLLKAGSERYILQRTGRRKKATATRDAATGRFTVRKRKGATSDMGNVRLLYRLVKRITLPARLDFVPTVTRTIREQWEPTMAQALDQALARARQK